MQPMDDTFVLNLDAQFPEWQHVRVKSSPPGRWGHSLSLSLSLSLSRLNGSRLVVFGGCGREGLLSDVFVLHLDAKNPTWKEVAGTARAPLKALNWFVSGGCTDAGVLLGDTFLLNLTTDKPIWKEIPTSWAPPSRLGHSQSVFARTKILLFGSLANSGHFKLRSGEAYTIYLGDEERRCTELEFCAFTGAVAPPPRLDHVAVSMFCGRVIIFGGGCTLLHSYPAEEKPSWRILNVPGKPPKFAWGHSTCVVGGTRVLVLGGHTGEEWVLDVLHELCLASRQDSDL